MALVVALYLATQVDGFGVPPPMGGHDRRTQLFAAPPLDESRVAVVLSLNARGVSSRAVDAALSCVPSEDVYATGTLEEARVAAEAIVERGYGTVVSAGGDGTLAAAVKMISEARAGWGDHSLDEMPRFVALPLGTGNAVARYVLGPGYRKWRGPRGVKRALKELGTASRRDLRVPVLRVDDDDLCFIAGCGFDSFILDDYQRLRRIASGVPIVRNVLASVFGYFVATGVSTLPQYALGNRKMRVRVSALDPNTTYVDPRRGDAALPIAGQVLYEGRATIVAAGATPFYGGGMRLFPFARTAGPSAVNLRIATMSPWRFIPNVLGIFAGNYRSPDFAFDFVGNDFRVDFLDDDHGRCSTVFHEDGKPVQHSGDALGQRRSFRLSVAGHVRFADLLGFPDRLTHLDHPWRDVRSSSEELSSP